MTFEQAFEKAAMERFEEVKMASLGNILKSLKARGGLSQMFSSGTVGQELGSAYRGLTDLQKSQLMGQLGTAAAGLGAGALLTDSNDSTISKLVVPAAAALGGLHLGKGLGGAYHGFTTAGK